MIEIEAEMGLAGVYIESREETGENEMTTEIAMGTLETDQVIETSTAIGATEMTIGTEVRADETTMITESPAVT